jgi:hypothetical protein
MYFTQSVNKDKNLELYVFSDASEQAIAAVGYIKQDSEESAFVFAKVKVAPTHGHTVPRLELCAALLATEVADTVQSHICMNIMKRRFYTDSKIVLGYINNQTRRFHNYVANRVERILCKTSREEWFHVRTELNPADHGTRGLTTVDELKEKWLTGPSFLKHQVEVMSVNYPLVQPENDKEIRIVSKKTVIKHENLLKRFARFSKWKSLVSAIFVLKRFLKQKSNMTCSDVELRTESELFIIKLTQGYYYPDEILQMSKGKALLRESSLISLCRLLDENNIIRVGGRLNQSVLPPEQKNPVIIPKKCHIATLIARHFHEYKAHQRRQITEGAIRDGGFWIMGVRLWV